jgi:diguanylate cyclase (GGDEF)-like protein/PAS domain S-box-containing protein
MKEDWGNSLRWVPAVAFASALAFGAYAMKLRDDAWRLEEAKDAEYIAAIQAASVKRVLDRALGAADTLATMIRYQGGSVENFDAYAPDILASAPGVANIQAAPQGVVRHIYPLAGQEKAIGHDLLADPARRREALRAIETRKATLAGPFKLVQGGEGMIGRRPVFLRDRAGSERFWGFASTLIYVDQLIGNTDLPKFERRGYAYQLWRVHPDSGERHVFAGFRAALANAASVEIEVPNGRWTLSVTNFPASRHAPLLWLDGLAALLGATLIASLLRRMLRQPQLLQEQVAAATAELAHRQAQLKALIDSIPDYIFFKDRNSVYLGCNKAYEARSGRDEKDLVGRTDLDLYPPEEAEFYRAKDREMLALGHPIQIEESVRGDDGSVSWFDTIKTPFFGPAGGVLGLVGVCRDITVRKQAEQLLRLSETVFETTSEGIMITDAAARIVRINPAFSAITGYSQREAVGKNASLVKSGRHDALFYERMWRELVEPGRWEGEIWNRRKSGEIYPEWLSIVAVRDRHGEVEQYVAVFSDITQRKRDEEFIRYQATHDALTGLPNRTLFMDRLTRVLAHASRTGCTTALLFIDLDGFKAVNDTSGHEAGDALLCATAERIAQCVREEDTVARLGGDEFTVILSDVAGAAGAATVAEKIGQAIAVPLPFRGEECRVSASIGIALSGKDSSDVATLLGNADRAMYEAKRAGRNAYRFSCGDRIEGAGA